MSCWLCRHSQHPEARLHNVYVVENVAAVCPREMAMEIHRDLVAEHPNDDGTSVDTILEHITQHSINPIVNMATMLRYLINLRDKMHKTLFTYDDDGNAILEPKMVDSYLKVQSQILLVYKQNETGKMLFMDKS